MNIQRKYASYYLDGREAKLMRGTIDIEKIAEQALKGDGSPHELTHKAAQDAAKELEFGKHKKQWLLDNEDDIKAEKLSADEAFRHYLAGRIDEATSTLEIEVVDVMTDIVNEEGDDNVDDSEDEDVDDD